LFLLSMAFGKQFSPEERQDRSNEDQQNGPDNGSKDEPGGECLKLDTAMPHNDLDNGRGRIDGVASWRQCDAYCMEENDCKFWTYQVKNGGCFLKTSDANQKKDKNGAISGSSGCSTETVHRMDACQNANDGFVMDFVIKVDGRCFRLSKTSGTPEDAQEMCNGVDGKMFEPKSKEVNDEVATAAIYHSSYWLGITKDGSDGTWRYKNGEQITYENWSNDVVMDGYCATASGHPIQDYNGQWIDRPCTHWARALCEF